MADYDEDRARRAIAGGGDRFAAFHLDARDEQATARPGPPLPGADAIDWRAVREAGRACCCPARPVVMVVMPATETRPEPVDLLLCGHHYRAGQTALRAAGATVYDEQGALLKPGA